MRSAKIAILCFFVLGVILLFGIGVQTFRVRDEDSKYYQKEKIARRGDLRKAKEDNKSVSFSQQRYGVLRSLWFDEKDGIRRQFHLQATMALFDLVLTPQGKYPRETFLRPHGWLQEKIGWEAGSSGEEVEQHGGLWRSVKTRKTLANRDFSAVVPFQTFRYYDATKAIWDIQKNEVTLFQVHFTDYKKHDHETVFDLANAKVLLKGYADEMTFHFKENGKEEVKSKGLKIHFEKE